MQFRIPYGKLKKSQAAHSYHKNENEYIQTKPMITLYNMPMSGLRKLMEIISLEC